MNVRKEEGLPRVDAHPFGVRRQSDLAHDVKTRQVMSFIPFYVHGPSSVRMVQPLGLEGYSLTARAQYMDVIQRS